MAKKLEYSHFPKDQGLYDPQFEKDACGVGFVCNITGEKTHTLIEKSLKVLHRLSHRGAVGADPKTGDGAGILIQIPHDFFASVCEKEKINLPDHGNYGTGLIFLPPDIEERLSCKEIFYRIICKENQELLGWRELEIDNFDIGKTAKETQPIIAQIFIKKNNKIKSELDFERTLYLIRKQVENQIFSSKLRQKSFFYITNLSARTFSYKGLLMPEQLETFFPELKNPLLKSALAIVHSRYSTNTFPTWDLAQPFRFLAHNGEINTLRGNINWMRAREGLLQHEFFNQNIDKLKPIIVANGSDSATIDNIFELLHLSGRSLAHTMTMLIPSAWENNPETSCQLRDFYRYHACIMEPWDGPAAIAFTDGKQIGAILDRNGLRPARYLITKDNFVVMASEVGVLDINHQDIAISGRLQPGKMFFIDTEEKRIIEDPEIKISLSKQKPYHQWIKKNLISLTDLPNNAIKHEKRINILTQLKAFGYSRQDLKMVITPMAEEGSEPTGSMGNDTPHAILSQRPKLLYDYFKQLFAQVTNPAIDPIREQIVMSLKSFLGSEKNLLEESEFHCHRIEIENPILNHEDFSKICNIKTKNFKAKTISTLFNPIEKGSLLKSIENICQEATLAIKTGYNFLILSDRGINQETAAIPALLAIASVHHHLVRESSRTQISLILESGEPFQVHHSALLFGYGADCIYPYLAYDTIQYLIEEKNISLELNTAINNYVVALKKGILKILSKMGISTIRSYRGAQIFEALGIGKEVIQYCFPGTASRINGINFNIIEEETRLRHQLAFIPEETNQTQYLSTCGTYQWRKDGEFHLWNPDTIAILQDATRKNNYSLYQEFSKLINEQTKQPTTLRSLLKFKKRDSIPLEQVQPAQELFTRFATGAMSFGSISKYAHETIAIAMNRLHGKSNTGEGGEDPIRFIKLPNGDSKRSAIKQIASGRFGVTTNYLVNADEIQIKIAQGAKPGEGGQLPGHKVNAIIAKTRYTTEGVTLISPPPHHDIYSIEDLAQLIFDLKNTNPQARISVKLVSEVGVGTIAAGVAKGHADMILISGGDGGTGASPLSSIFHAGLPWELGLSETHQTLVLNNLRNRVRLQTDGQLRTGRDVAIAAILGAEEFGFCTSALIVLGCVMLRHCNLNNCSVGIATQDDILQKKFSGRSEHLINYFSFVTQELREIMAQLGIAKIEDLIGNTDLLEINQKNIPWKAKNIDFSKILYKPVISKDKKLYCVEKQNHRIEDVLDQRIIQIVSKNLDNAKPVKLELEISNFNRSTGAMLSGTVCKKFGEAYLPENTIACKFTGVAGQSFGAFLARGITFELEGMANDYIGKGISGGKIIVYPNKKATYKPEENIIIGNTSFYGAISGQAYIRGIAGERFCIRNSGLNAVVEGIGDHGCEYMTGGNVVILGETGRNFAAGMSGGIAYIYDKNNTFKKNCNLSMVELENLSEENMATLYNLIHNHFVYTKSTVADKILKNFHQEKKYFIKIIPVEYKKVLEIKSYNKNSGLTEVSDG